VKSLYCAANKLKRAFLNALLQLKTPCFTHITHQRMLADCGAGTGSLVLSTSELSATVPQVLTHIKFLQEFHTLIAINFCAFVK